MARKIDVLVVSRHEGTINYISKLFSSDFFNIKVKDHIEKVEEVKEDIIVGNLPLNLIQKLLAKGKKFFYVALNIPRELRGKEIEDVSKYIEIYEVNSLELAKW